MNKITPRLIRDLNETLPEGTECYLCEAVRNALFNYRKGREPSNYINKEQALPMLAQRLGRGLKNFFVDDVRQALDAYEDARVGRKFSWPT